jgi:hypothetical protein
VTTAAPLQELTRGAVTHPAGPPSKDVPLFRTWQDAVRHLCDHVLTAPECHGWLIVLPGYFEIIDPDNFDARKRYAAAAEQTRGVSAQPLYDLYALAVRVAALDSACLGWCNTDADVAVALGTSGVLLVIQGAYLRTAFLSGQGDAAAVRESWEAAGAGAGVLSRERGMRSGRPGRSAGAREHDRPGRQRAEERWSAEERLYYYVFRPAVQFIRSRYHASRDLTGHWLDCDYALLKPVLPPFSRLKLADWQELRRQCKEAGTP